jgi:lysozyme
MMSKTADQEAAELAARFEGFSAEPYLDMLAKPPRWTIGYGSVWLPDGAPVTENTPPITLQLARIWLADELHKTAREIARVVKVWLTVDETAALQDFIYNVGIGAFDNSTLLRKLNSGDYAGAAAQIDLWDHAGGKVVAGLLRRRQAETALFLESDEKSGKDA